MCQPGRPLPQGEGQKVSSLSLCAFHIARVGAHAKVDVAFGGIGVTGIDEGGDVVDDLLHALRRQRLVVGTAEAERVCVGEVVGGHLGGELGARAPLGLGCFIDLVVDVGDVHGERHEVALVFEKAREQGEDDEGTRVSDVDARVHGRAAGVDPDTPGIARLKLEQLAAGGVVKAHGSHLAKAP